MQAGKVLNKLQDEQICEQLNERLLSFSFFARGNHNDSYLVETSKRKYVLRIENNFQFDNLKKEYKRLKSLKPGLAPKVYLYDDSCKIIQRKYIIEEFIPGKNPKNKATNEFVLLMANWFKRLHKIKTAEIPECTEKGYYSLSCAIIPYYKNFDKYKYNLEPKFREGLEGLVKKALELCEKNDKLFYRCKRFSILHKDPSKGNILIKGKSIKLIDWEFSSVGVPQWDLVYFLQSYSFEKYQKALFLDAYGYPKTSVSKKQLDMIALLNVAAGIGYSVWRLDLVQKKKVNREEQKGILARLKKDEKLLKGIVKEM